MDPVTVTLAIGLSIALQFVGRAADITLDKALEILILDYGAERVKHHEAEVKALEAALIAARQAGGAGIGTPLGRALNKIKDNPPLATCVATATIEMVSNDPAHLPPDLLKKLDLPADQHLPFARFLFALRQNLSGIEPYAAGIRYADALDQRGILRKMLHPLYRQLEIDYRQLEIDEAFLADRRLTTDDAAALSAYLTFIRTQLQFSMLPLARRSGPETRVDVELTEVFVPLTLRDPQVESRSRIKQHTEQHSLMLLEFVYVQDSSFGEILTRYPCFLLKGPPGCGKTTLLRQAALSFAKGSAVSDLEWNGPALLPVFLRLRNFGNFLHENRDRFPSPSHGALLAFMENHFREEHRLALSPGFFDRRLTEGNCLILLDGLDEVSLNRQEVAQHVNAFLRRFASQGNRFGLASRPKGYDAVELYLRPAALAVAEVNPLDPNGIRQLVGNLVRCLVANPLQRAQDAADLPRAILDSHDLTKLAGRPLFCTALVLIYKYHGARLPQRRVEAYEEIVDLLLGFWKAQDHDLALPHELAAEDGTGVHFADVSAAVEIKKRRLAHLALWMQTTRLTDASAQRACARLRRYLRVHERKDKETARIWAENFLHNSHERSGIFVEMEAGRYAFTHQGLREHLAATALVNQRESEFVRAALTHLNDDWWEQVILLSGAHPRLPDATRDYLINEILDSASAALSPTSQHAYVLMAGQCAVDMASSLFGPRRESVERALLHLMRDTHDSRPYPDDPPRLTSPDDLPPKTRLAAGELLNELGWTPPDLHEFIWITTRNPEYAISKYPVTNLQYARFLAAPDYTDEALWQSVMSYDAQGQLLEGTGQEAWKWFCENGGKDRRPSYWDNARVGVRRSLFPVVGVTWYEAAAYCAWLGRHREHVKVDSLPENVIFRLPLETEWEAAAGGAANDRYPWQMAAESVNAETIRQYANTWESDLGDMSLGGTTPVCMYPSGKSLAGIIDMSGNVWEWQANKHDSLWYALRGGAWLYSLDYAHVAARRSGRCPGDWDGCGLRVVAASIST